MSIDDEKLECEIYNAFYKIGELESDEYRKEHGRNPNSYIMFKSGYKACRTKMMDDIMKLRSMIKKFCDIHKHSNSPSREYDELVKVSKVLLKET